MSIIYFDSSFFFHLLQDNYNFSITVICSNKKTGKRNIRRNGTNDFYFHREKKSKIKFDNLKAMPANP